MSAAKTDRHWSDSLVLIGACANAVAWAKEQPSLQAAWDSCQRGDWMMWLVGKTCDRRAVVLAACDCAETVLPIFETRYPDDARTMKLAERADIVRRHFPAAPSLNGGAS